ncbi:MULTISPECIES: disulfide oxidoreductase [Bacillaceae]|uniref:Probable disulfide formation protein n=1 Tax=Evansella alkalicola TaxID=745819 RepID=A0ABS6JW09_9BACI|nr:MULTISPECIES: disulfide oxidoreductase [Bacillaceae]MBU9721874.1 disulfide bond formation protein B [Bacillus alkalicola]
MEKQKKIEYAMFISWGIAVIATLGSLYFSEIRHYIPCSLCWIQRIFMYPMAITLAIATVKKDAKQAYYTLPISVIGLGFSTYHYMLEKIPALSQRAEACGIIPCNYAYINWFGFITIPFLAGLAFLLISLLMIWVIKLSKE